MKQTVGKSSGLRKPSRIPLHTPASMQGRPGGKRGLLVVAILIVCAAIFGVAAPVAAGAVSPGTNLHIATVDNRPLSIDRLIYTAFEDTGYSVTVTTSASLQQGYELANNGERAGVISSTPDMESVYPNLRKVPVVLERNIIFAFAKTDRSLAVDKWDDLMGYKIGMLTQRVYMLSRVPEGTEVIAKENTKQLLDGLAAGEYDIVLLSLRAHETVILPDSVTRAGQIETLNEYLYLHKNYASLIPMISDGLNGLIEDGRAESILSDQTVEGMYEKKTVLHIYSSDAELAREDLFSKKLKEPFMDDTSLEWYALSLNSKRFSMDPSRLTYFANLLRQDCVSRNVVAIIVSGTDALNFLKEYYYLFFRNTPVLVYGVNDSSALTIEGFEKYFKGIANDLSALDTALTALELFPDTKNLFVINDYSLEGRNYQKSIEKQLAPMADRINIEYNENIDREELLRRIEALTPDSIVLVGSYFCDVNGQYYPQNDMKRALESHCTVPVVTMYSTDLPYNAVGGKCLDYEKNGVMIADMLTRLLNGENIEELTIISEATAYNRWVFDKVQMDRFSILESDVPFGSQFLNKKPTIFETNPVFVSVMSMLLLMSIIIIILIQVHRNRDDAMRKEQDIRQKRHEEELRQAAIVAEEGSRMKSIFLANMSHEIRTPINGIIGFLELALDEEIAPKIRDYLMKIRDSSEGLLRIINDILDISKVEAGRIELENIPFNIHDVFEVCKGIISPRAQEKGISLYCYAEPSVGKKLLGDPTRLRQVLLNLLSNAVKFTNTGIVKLLASVEKMDENSVTMHFEIKDSGIGMTAEQIEKVFDPFVQADSSTTRKYGGTGLGLPITKNIVELMGGKLTAESIAGMGSKFSFDLVFQVINAPEDISTPEIAKNIIQKPVFSGEVLVCEDNAMNQQVIREHLARVGLRTVIAETGKDGVDIVAERIASGGPQFDLIFMDIHMPVMDGLDATKNLAQIGNKTPVIALTANVMPSDRETYRSHGMSDYVSKPFTSQELWACLMKYITPSVIRPVEEREHVSANEALRDRMKTNFVQDNQTTLADMHAALEAGDTTLAHRIAHTLKSTASLIGKAKLQQAAQTVEALLLEENLELAQEQMGNLERELQETLKELAPLLQDTSPAAIGGTPFDTAAASELFAKLEALLTQHNSECLDLLDDLRAIPGTDRLARQIEEYEFKDALKTLADLRREMGD